MKLNPSALKQLLTLVILFCIPAAVEAGTFTVFGSRNFIRNSGTPVTETASFNVKNPGTTYTMHIYNGGFDSEYSLVSSAAISLNGTTVFTTSDFNQKVAHLQKEVILSTYNNLQVDLRSSPASAITIIIEGVDNTPPSIAITAPSNNAYLNTPSIAVSGTAADAITNVASVYVNGTIAQISGETYSTSIQLTEGPNTITATATETVTEELVGLFV